MPKNCIFSDKGPAIFINSDNSQELLALLSIVNSPAFKLLIDLQMAFGSYEVGVIQRTPIPDLTGEETATLATLARRAWSLNRNLDTITQTSHAFILPALLQVQGATLSQRAQVWATTVATTEQELAQIQAEIDAVAFDLYGISPEEVGAGSDQGSVISGQEGELDTDHRPLATEDDEDDTTESADLPSLVHGLIEYALGVALGRFDIRLAIGERPHPPEPEPFDPLPACSPGMLVVESDQGSVDSDRESDQWAVGSGQKGKLGTDHRPLTTPPTTGHRPPTTSSDIPPNYPIDIPFNGILVDDEGHPSDIVGKIRDVLDAIFPESGQGPVDSDQQTPLPTAHRPLTTNPPTAGDIEQEACQILRVASLRDYIAKPSAFFAEHLSRYSKSRRQAPIYWPLSTRSGGYTLWLYYHRLTDQTFYTCINDFVEPKLRRVQEQVAELRRQQSEQRSDQGAVDSGQKGKPSTAHRPLSTAHSLETLQTLELELIDLRDELLRIAQLPYKPNLNDGVQITAAPLWPLFGLKKWQTKLKDTWKKLEKGDYDWAHLAYSIWPERVREKCKGDKSLAIAHDLEALYEAPPEKPKKSRRPRT